MMDRDECVRILEEYNQWRRGGDGDQPSPTVIGIAIDRAIEFIKEDICSTELL